MTNLRARLAEVLAKLAGEEFDRDTGEYLAISLCQDPAIARELEDAELFRKLESMATQKTAYDVYGNGGHWSVGFFSDDQRLSFREAIDAARNRHE